MPNNPSVQRSALSFTLGSLVLAALLAIAVATTASASPTGTQTVTTTADAGPGSLRQAIADAAPGDTIDFALTTPATITLTSGQLAITKPLTITGPGPDLLAVSGNDSSRIFRVEAPGGSNQISVTLSGLTIRDGYSLDDGGGGLWNDQDLTLEAITFAGNFSLVCGGGMYNRYSSSPLLVDVVFRDNAVIGDSDADGGGLCAGGSPKLAGVVFAGNRALGDWSSGGGLYISGDAMLTDVAFIDNSANRGGALQIGSGSAELTNVSFISNTAESGGGIYYNAYGSPELANLRFVGNTAEQGGAMHIYYGSPTLVNATFSNNTAGQGGAIYGSRSTYAIRNSIFWGNRATSSGDQIYNSISEPLVSHSIVEGSGGSGPGWDSTLGLDEGGNLDADPRFVQPPGAGLVPGDLRLRWDSPAIDAGNNLYLPPGLSTDLAGEPRLICGSVDMGAYEYQSGLCLRKEANHTWLTPGQPFTYTLVAWNTFSDTAMTGALISDSLPTGVEFAGPIELDPPGAGLAGTAPPVLASDLTLAPGQAVTVTFPVTLANGAPLGDLANTAAITSTEVPTLRFASHSLLVCETHLTVTSPADGGAGSLRQAIASVCPQGSIDFALTTPATITLTGGQLSVRKSLTISGPGPDLLAVSGNDAGRVFRVETPDGSSPISVTISGLTIRDGSLDAGSGGGLWNDADLALSGVTIRENWADGNGCLYNEGGNVWLSDVAFYDNVSGWWGGAMYNANATATLSRVIFERNSSRWGNGGGLNNFRSDVILHDVTFNDNAADDYGGGLYNRACSPELVNVTFSGNSAIYGGGIGNESESAPVLTHVTFTGNSASRYGGGYFGGGSLTDVVFRDNLAYYGGGIYARDDPVLSDVTFVSNWAEASGGGIYTRVDPVLSNVTFTGNSVLWASGGGLYSEGSPILNGVTFEGNSAGYGGGMASMGGSPILTNVVFAGNWVADGWNHGGGMYSYRSTATLVNVAFRGNSSQGGGGGMGNLESSPTLTNVTFQGNAAKTGGAMGNYGNSNPTLQNSILWANQAITGTQIYNEVSTPTLAYCDVQGSGGSGAGWDASLGTDLGGNLDANPHFLDPLDPGQAPITTGDLRLWFLSPAVDAGDNALLPPGLVTDLAGAPRIANGVVDMGAYEVQPGLQLYKSASHGQAIPGQALTYTIVAANTFTETVITSAVISDPLPGGLDYVGPIALDPPGAGAVGASPPILVAGLTIQPQQMVTVTLPVRVQPVASPQLDIVNTATIASPQVLQPQIAVHTLPICSLHSTVVDDADAGLGSLRQAIADACPGGSIDFALASPATISLTSGELNITKSLTITGPGPDLLAISGGGTSRVFRVGDARWVVPIPVTIAGLTVRDGVAEDGGGLWNAADLTLTDVTVTGNRASRDGGGLYNAGDRNPWLADVTFVGNAADRDGGGLYNDAGNPTLAGVTFSANTAAGRGGGVHNEAGSPVLSNVAFDGNSAGHGGGMGNVSGDPVLEDVTFRDNRATNGGGWGAGYGTSASPVLTHVTFTNNSASNDGGGMFSDGNPALENVTFTGNSAGGNGGGIFNRQDSGPVLANATFTGNSAGNHGGAIYNHSVTTAFTNVVITGNTAGGHGGGVYNDGGGPALTDLTFNGNSAAMGGGLYNRYSGAHLLRVTFGDNSATGADPEGSGGGIYNVGGGPTLEEVTFDNNSASNDGGGIFNLDASLTLTGVALTGNTASENGGGMYNQRGSPEWTDGILAGNSAYHGGGIYNDWSGQLVLTNLVFLGNRAIGEGGGMYNYGDPVLSNLSFNGNLATLGGGIYNLYSQPTIRNSILWGNGAALGAQVYNDNSTPTFAYCDVQGSGGSGAGWDGSLGSDLGGNLDVDPWFRHPIDPVAAPTTDGDLHLRWGSPAIDAGHNDLIPPGVTTDLDGKPRIFNGTVDMGAYENQSCCANYLPLVFKDSQP